jgi:hypothetical protein
MCNQEDEELLTLIGDAISIMVLISIRNAVTVVVSVLHVEKAVVVIVGIFRVFQAISIRISIT